MLVAELVGEHYYTWKQREKRRWRLVWLMKFIFLQFYC